MTWEEACRLLGVPENATQAEIKDQYFYKVQLLHPDKNLNKPEKVIQRAGEELALVNEAYKLLSDPKNDPHNPPKLEVTPRYVRFAGVGLGQKKSTVIEVKNTGGPFTNVWIDNSPAPWLTVTDIKAAGGEPLPLAVTIEALGLPEIILEEESLLRIRLKNEKTQLADELDVGVEIVPEALPAKLKVKPGKMVFPKLSPGSIHSRALEIKNAGPDTLHGYINTRGSWLSISQSIITLPRRSVSRGFVVQADANNLGARIRDRGFVEIFTNGGHVTIPVDIATSAQPVKQHQAPSYAAAAPSAGHPPPGAGYLAWTPSRKGTGGFSFIRFIFIFALTFLVGFGVIYLLTANTLKGLDIGAVRGWALITFFVSLLVTALHK